MENDSRETYSLRRMFPVFQYREIWKMFSLRKIILIKIGKINSSPPCTEVVFFYKSQLLFDITYFNQHRSIVVNLQVHKNIIKILILKKISPKYYPHTYVAACAITMFLILFYPNKLETYRKNFLDTKCIPGRVCSAIA